MAINLSFSIPIPYGILTIQSLNELMLSIAGLNLAYNPLLSLVFGILILMFPKFLNYMIAIYLILVGLIGLFGT